MSTDSKFPDENNTNSEKDEPLLFNKEHVNLTHERWVKHMNRVWPAEEDDIPDLWTIEQCGQCRYYIPLQGKFSLDWGVCSHSLSDFDGRVMFEHDGCDQYSEACMWVGAFIDDRSEQETKD